MPYHRFINSFLMVFFLYTEGYGQKTTQDKADRVVQNKNIFGRFIGASMVNDANPALNQRSNDKGYTLGLFLFGRFSQPAKRRYIDVWMSSRLYTKTAGEPYKDPDGRDIEPQYFTEISLLNMAYHQYHRQQDAFLVLQAGMGIYNRQEPIPGLVLFVQGGQDGRGGYHKLLGDNPGQDNIPTGDIDLNFYVQASGKKPFLFHTKKGADAAFFDIESGVRLGFPIIQSSLLFFKTHALVPVIRIQNKDKNILKLSVRCSSTLSFHSDGVLFAPETGLEFRLFFFTLGYTTLFPLGNQQNSYISYSDSEALMNVYARIHF